MQNTKRIQDAIKAYMTKFGITAARFAEVTNTNKGSVSRWLSGKTTSISDDNWNKIHPWLKPYLSIKPVNPVERVEVVPAPIFEQPKQKLDPDVIIELATELKQEQQLRKDAEKQKVHFQTLLANRTGKYIEIGRRINEAEEKIAEAKTLIKQLKMEEAGLFAQLPADLRNEVNNA